MHQFAEKLELYGYSRRVIADYPAYVERFFRYLAEHEQIRTPDAVTVQHINGYHAFLQYRKRADGTYLSTATVRVRLQVVKTFFSILHREGILPVDIAATIELPRLKKSLPRHVPSEKEMQQLLDTIEPADPITLRDRAMLELLYATALRNQEVRSVTLDALDIAEKTLFVTGKGSCDRVVPVGSWVIPWLIEYLETVRPKLATRYAGARELFLSKNGRRLTNANLNDLLRKYSRRASLSVPVTPHSIRHACATHLLKAGADIRYVQELLGHAQLSTTQIYTKIDITFLQQAHKQYHPREQCDNDR